MAKSAKSKAAKSKKGSRPHQVRICNLLPSLATEQDWHFEDALTAGALTAPAALPASVDLRATWWDVGDQKDTGSCVGWASTDGVARYMLVKANKLAKTEHLSPRFTWMASKETDQATTIPETMLDCAGTFLKAAADILRNYGAVPDSLLPFVINTAMYTGKEKDFFATAATRKITSYFNLQRNLPQWKSWLPVDRADSRGAQRRRHMGQCRFDGWQAGCVPAGHRSRGPRRLYRGLQGRWDLHCPQ